MLSSPIPVALGEILAGKYRIDRVLGAGGMGVVVAAEHLQLRQTVAIKFVLPDALGSNEALERFLREARAVVRLKSEHVARVIDVATLANGSPYMVMEFLSGSTLGALAAREGPLPIERVAHYVIQACEALAEAHSLGIIHRDIKPENLFLTRSVSGAPLVKVLDFGVSKMESVTGTRGLTHTSALMGSPLYMAPEQMRSARAATPRSDIWALGVVVYDLLCRSLPFDAESMPELCLKVTLEPPSPLRVRRPDVPAELEGVVMRCLEKDPAKRYPSAAELASELAPFAPPEASAAVERARLIARGLRPDAPSGTLEAPKRTASLPGEVSHTSTPRSMTVPEPERETPRRKRRRRLLTTAMGAVGLAVGLGIPLTVLYSRADGPATPPEGTTLLHATRIARSPDSEKTPRVATPPLGTAVVKTTMSAPRPAPTRARPVAPPSPPRAASPPPSSPPPSPPPPSPPPTPGRHDDIPTMR